MMTESTTIDNNSSSSKLHHYNNYHCFHFVRFFPTSFLALLIFILLGANGFTIFYLHLPVFPAKSPPEPASFLPEKASATATTTKLSVSVMYSVKEENPDVISHKEKPHLPDLKKVNNLLINLNNTSLRTLERGRNRGVIRVYQIPIGLFSEQNFSTRMKNFVGDDESNSSSSHCKFRFFMTWISSLDSFSNRELFSIQSLFKSHPTKNVCLVIVSKSMDSIPGIKLLAPFVEKGFRVTAISPDYEYIFKNTFAESWFNKLKRGNIDPGEVALGQNLSNLLRLALLYKYGGIYLDTDVIVLKSLLKLRNVIGAQAIDQETRHWSRLNNAVMIFDKNHPLLYKFIQEFALTFNGNKWGHNGPYLVSRVVARLQNRTGYDFTVLPPTAFYPVDWSRIHNLFEAPKDENDRRWLVGKLRQIRKESFAVHLWNRQSRSLAAEHGSIVSYIRSNFCIFCNSSIAAL